MNHTGNITVSETWALVDSPHVITGNVTVRSGAKLTIEAGCQVQFNAGKKLTIGYSSSSGELQAVGTLGNEIVFTSSSGSPSAGDWDAIYFSQTTVASQLKFAIIEYCTNGIYYNTATAHDIEDIEIRYSSTYGVYALVISTSLTLDRFHIHNTTYGVFNASTANTLNLKNFLIHDPVGTAIGIYQTGAGGTLNIDSVTIFGTWASGMRRNSGTASITNSIVTGCTYGLRGTITSTYNDIYGNTTNDYYGGASAGTGDISVDPQLYNPTTLDEDDYRLKSTKGRWNGSAWEDDASDSPCIDAGDPLSTYSNEPDGNGGVINMGWDGNTAYASRTTDPATEEIEDINNDFRSITTTLEYINNDFRMAGQSSTYDINNDIRARGAELCDINNKFNMVGSEIIYDINNKFTMRLTTTEDINNKFNMTGSSESLLLNINNKINTVIADTEDVYNHIVTVKRVLSNVNNKINTLAQTLSNINNDFRMIASWQIPANAGFESLGKSEVKVYIDTVIQTDVDVDSINISRNINSAGTASFKLGRAYDSTKPDMDSTVEIKYNDVTVYKGYITEITPSDSPESMTINCEDKFKKQNKTIKYFYVGHKPTANAVGYYDTIKEALSTEGSFSVDIGNFVPQTMDLFNKKESDAITDLITNCGNFGWYYDVAETKQLWQAERGSIIDLERQALGSNLDLHNVISHQFKESVTDIVNRLRVQMGNKILNSTATDISIYSYTYSKYLEMFATPAWDVDTEKLASQSSDGVGLDWHDRLDEDDYSDTFKVYNLPAWLPDPDEYRLDPKYPPFVRYNATGFTMFGGSGDIMTEGFTIDFDNKLLIFNEPQFECDVDGEGNIYNVYAVPISLTIFVEKVEDLLPSDGLPTTVDATNPLAFVTTKVGTYADTVLGFLELSDLGIKAKTDFIDPTIRQTGTHISWNIGANNIKIITLYDDTDYAEDYAYWQLSNSAYKKIEGTIDITIDTLLFYNIDLKNRIMIDGVIDNAFNIKAIDINFNTFTATITLEDCHYYLRTESLQSRGESTGLFQ